MFLSILAISMIGCLGKARQEPSVTNESCNIVLISIDTLRADRMSLYGYSRDTTPYLVELAEESIVFDTFIMNGGFTLPSHMSMMTSLLPTVHGIRPGNDRALPEARITLAEQLRDAGYVTGAFVDAGYLRAHYGFYQGFDVYDDNGGRFAEILPKAYQWLDIHHDRPFFLFLHTFDVHSQWTHLPYDCPADYPKKYADQLDIEFDGRKNGKRGTAMLRWVNSQLEEGQNPLSADELAYISALYDGCINYVDEKIAEVVSTLHHYGIYDQTLIVITSDHGEEFLDHGRMLHVQRGYEELVRIPLLIKLPDAAFGGTRISELTAMIDIMPTILDVAGISLNHEAQGKSLMPAVTPGEELRRHAPIWRALRTDRWKFIPERALLFDLSTDPGELSNVYAQNPEVVAELQRELDEIDGRDQLLRAALAQVEVGGTGKELELTEEQLEELRALGYIE